MSRMYQEARLTKDTRVRLRSHVDPAIYGDFACVGNEGYIREIREDRFGLPEYLIEWDRNHWTWNGISNGWAFAEHFEPVEETMEFNEETLAAIAQGVQAFMKLSQQQNATKAEKPEAKTESTGSSVDDMIRNLFGGEEQEAEGDDQAYARGVEAASGRLAESDAFILIGMDRHQNPRAPEGVLEPYVLVQSKSPEGHVLLSAYLSELGSRAHYKLAVEKVAAILNVQDA